MAEAIADGAEPADLVLELEGLRRLLSLDFTDDIMSDEALFFAAVHPDDPRADDARICAEALQRGVASLEVLGRADVPPNRRGRVMAEEVTSDRARALTLRAAQWLALIRFQVRAGAPTFTPDVSTYHDMFDPAAADERRLAACRRMHEVLRRQAELERWAAEGIRAQSHPRDPYGREWMTTPRGAILETIAGRLSEAVETFEAAGVRGH